jgi:hypothetical protein
MINRPVGGELYHADGHTGMTKLIVAFQQFCEASKTSCQVLIAYFESASYLSKEFIDTRGSYYIYLNLGTTSIVLGRGETVFVKL